MRLGTGKLLALRQGTAATSPTAAWLSDWLTPRMLRCGRAGRSSAERIILLHGDKVGVCGWPQLLIALCMSFTHLHLPEIVGQVLLMQRGHTAVLVDAP